MKHTKHLEILTERKAKLDFIRTFKTFEDYANSFGVENISPRRLAWRRRFRQERYDMAQLGAVYLGDFHGNIIKHMISNNLIKPVEGVYLGWYIIEEQILQKFKLR